jgi:hypothetical protein
MLQNKLIIGIGALVFLTVATGFIMIGVQQRQTTRPNAQVTDTFSCPFGSTPPDPAGRCPSGFVPVPVYPTGGGQQSIGGTTSIGSGAFGGDGGDINPTGSINSPSPTPQVLGFCCMPLGQLTPTPTPFGEPTPTITPFVPNPPTPTSCPGGGEQLVVDSQTGCSATDRCDFSVTTDGSGNILTRSLWSDGSFGFGAQDQSAQRFDEKIFTYNTPGTYDISLTCSDTQTTCTKQVTITEQTPGICSTPTPSSAIPTLSPTPTVLVSLTPTITLTPTPGACRVPVPQLQFRCPDGCSQQQ